MATLSRDMTRAEFDAMLEETFTVLQTTGLPTKKEKVREDLLARFAELLGVTAAEAELKLDGPPPAPPTPVKTPAEKKKTLREATRAMRTINAGAKFFWESPKDAAFFDLFLGLRRDAGLVANLLITGPSGSGKTEGVQQAATRAGLACYKVDCPSITTAEKWVGHKEIDDKGTHYVLSEHLKWLSATDCAPGVVLYDEINRLHPALHNILFPVFDGSQRIWVPELGTYIDVHPETVVIATANLGAGFTGTHRMDDAMIGRLGYRMERDWPPRANEIEILVKRTGIAEKDAATLVDIAAATRQMNTKGDLSIPVSTRNLLDTAALVTAGQTIQQATEYTFALMYSADGGAGSERLQVRQIVQGKAAGR